MNLTDGEDLTVVMTSDDGQTLRWDVSSYKRNRITKTNDIFRDINGYWNALSYSRRAAIFNKYKEISEHLSSVGIVSDEVFSLTQFAETLTQLVTELYELMPYEEIEQWMFKHSVITYPDTLRTSHDPDDMSPDRTYLISDYRELAAFTVALRPMVPIWGSYIKMTDKAAGTLFKEYNAFRIVGRTNLMRTKPYDRLLRFIACLNRSSDTFSAILKGLASSDIPEWLLAIIAVRRLSAGEVDASEENGNIIANVYRFVDTTLSDLPKRFGSVQKKKPADEKRDDDNSSTLELYRSRQTVSTGDIMKYNVYARNIDRMISHVDNTVDTAIIDKCCESHSTIMKNNIAKVQITIVQWVLNDIISAQAVPNLYKEELVNCIIATQALLLHWGFPVIAMLIGAQECVPENINKMTTFARIKMDDKLVQELNKFYPYKINTEGTQKYSNVAQASIVKVAEVFNNHAWHATINPSLVSPMGINLEAQRRIRLMYNDTLLVNQLAQLVIFINKQSEK